MNYKEFHGPTNITANLGHRENPLYHIPPKANRTVQHPKNGPLPLYLNTFQHNADLVVAGR